MLVQLCCLIVLLSTKTLNAGKDVTSNLENVGQLLEESTVSFGNEIKKGQYIQSPMKQFTLVMQTDCNFVLYVCNFYIYLLFWPYFYLFSKWNKGF